MKLSMFIPQQFAVFRNDQTNEVITLKLNDNASYVYSVESPNAKQITKYNSITEIQNDTGLSPVVIWMARGLAGIPLKIKNAASLESNAANETK